MKIYLTQECVVRLFMKFGFLKRSCRFGTRNKSYVKFPNSSFVNCIVQFYTVHFIGCLAQL